MIGGPRMLPEVRDQRHKSLSEIPFPDQLEGPLLGPLEMFLHGQAFGPKTVSAALQMASGAVFP